MSRRSIVILRPRKPSLGARLGTSVAEVLDEVVTFERTHARLAWCVTAVGLVIGLALQSL